MTRLYDTFEPAVLNESLLLEAVREQGPRGEAGRVALEEGIAFEEVTELKLDFKSKRGRCCWGRSARIRRSAVCRSEGEGLSAGVRGKGCLQE